MSLLMNPQVIAGGINALGSLVGGLFGKKGSDNAAKIQYKIAQETNANKRTKGIDTTSNNLRIH